MTDELLTTPQAAKRLGMSGAALRSWIYRNPDLKPAMSLGPVHGWTEAEIEAVRLKRIELRKRPRPTEGCNVSKPGESN